MPHQVVIASGITGPNRGLSGLTLQNAKGVDFQLDAMRLFVQVEQHTGDNIKEFDLSATTAVTFALNAGSWTVTVI